MAGYKVTDLNEGQKAAFFRVADAIMDPSKEKLHFMQGIGGTGKTRVIKTLREWGIAKGLSLIFCATTAIAATLIGDADTVHAEFLIPWGNLSSNAYMRITEGKKRRLREANAIVIDEATMLGKKVFEHLDQMLRWVMTVDEADPCTEDFGGKIILLSGDWNQLLPVNPRGYSATAQLEVTIRTSPLWNLFTTIELTENMRVAPEEVDYRELLQRLIDYKGKGNAAIPERYFEKELKELIKWVYPLDVLHNPLREWANFIGHAVLCPLNKGVDKVNRSCLRSLPGQERVYEAEIQPSGYELTEADRKDRKIPSNTLTLKPGAMVHLTKHIDKKAGLANGVRLQVIELGNDVVQCRIMSGAQGRIGAVYPIRREWFLVKKEAANSARVIMKQFPIELGFAMTVHKAQGHTMAKVGYDVTEGELPVHGLLYTTFSRVQNASSIRVCNGKWIPGPAGGSPFNLLAAANYL